MGCASVAVLLPSAELQRQELVPLEGVVASEGGFPEGVFLVGPFQGASVGVPPLGEGEGVRSGPSELALASSATVAVSHNSFESKRPFSRFLVEVP